MFYLNNIQYLFFRDLIDDINSSVDLSEQVKIPKSKPTADGKSK